MQCDQRHLLFLGGDGRAAQRFKQMIESLNHRTQRGHSLSEEPLLCANRPTMQCIVGLRKAQHMNLHHAKRALKESMGYKVFAVFMAFALCLPTTLTSNLTNMRQAQAATEAAQEYASPMAAILLLRTLIPASIPAQTPRRVQAPRTARIQLIPPMPVLLLTLPMERTPRLQRMT